MRTAATTDGIDLVPNPLPTPDAPGRVSFRHHAARPGVSRLVRRCGTTETPLTGWDFHSETVRRYGELRRRVAVARGGR
jgi:hypothetical protein